MMRRCAARLVCVMVRARCRLTDYAILFFRMRSRYCAAHVLLIQRFRPVLAYACVECAAASLRIYALRRYAMLRRVV